MVRNTSVIFRGGGYQKEFHHLNEEEHNMVVKALFTGFGQLGSDGIVVGKGWSDQVEDLAGMGTE